jgi:hypothetical protein
VQSRPSETTAGTTKFYLKTRKGVCNYTWSQFPFHPDPVNGFAFRTFEKEARITDWAVYQNGKRTAGTATDGEAFEWMAGDGKIELPTGASGASVLVPSPRLTGGTVTDGFGLSTNRRGDALRLGGSTAVTRRRVTTLTTQQGSSSFSGGQIYVESSGVHSYLGIAIAGGVPVEIGYTYKKIAQLDWNDTTNQWDVTQYLRSALSPCRCIVSTHHGRFARASAAFRLYEQAVTDEFDGIVNYSWFEGTWAITGYTLNSVELVVPLW